MENQETIESEEMGDTVTNLGFSEELIEEIRSTKMAHPEMFVSAWEVDNTGIYTKDLEGRYRMQDLFEFPVNTLMFLFADLQEQFLTAAENGDLEILQKLFTANPDLINAKDKDGYTALHRAAYNNHLDTITFLLSNDADANARTTEMWTPLMSAANWANFEAIALLLSHGVSVNAVSKGNASALHIALSGQSDSQDSVVTCVRYLLQAPGIDVGIISGAGDTPLMIARRSSIILHDLISDHIER